MDAFLSHLRTTGELNQNPWKSTISKIQYKRTCIHLNSMDRPTALSTAVLIRFHPKKAQLLCSVCLAIRIHWGVGLIKTNIMIDVPHRVFPVHRAVMRSLDKIILSQLHSSSWVSFNSSHKLTGFNMNVNKLDRGKITGSSGLHPGSLPT